MAMSIASPSHNGQTKQKHTPVTNGKTIQSLTPASPFYLNDPTYMDDSNITVSATMPCEASVAYVSEQQIARLQGMTLFFIVTNSQPPKMTCKTPKMTYSKNK